MPEASGTHIIRRVRRKWIVLSLLSDALVATGLGTIVAAIIHNRWSWSGTWVIGYSLVIFLVLVFIHRPWKWKEVTIAQWLDQQYPQLEESTGLLLKAPPALNFLERLQVTRTGQALQLIPSPVKTLQKIKTPAALLLCMTLAAWLLYQLPSATTHPPIVKSSTPVPAAVKEKILPQVAGVTITIHPPAYTGKKNTRQNTFNLVAVQGAVINWQLATNTGVQQATFVFSNTTEKKLQPLNTAYTDWRFENKIDSSGFYQLNIDGVLSELYKIEIIPDRPPLIQLLSPQQYTTIDYGEIPRVKINGSISDDYGVKDAFIAATIASGSGEAVKFATRKLPLAGFVAGKTHYSLQQIMSLPAMGMHAGDELYFYVEATDSHQQAARSDIYIVRLPDTAQLMSIDGLSNTLNLKPDYFRSQRQIIIETEQLLKDKDTISAQAFNNRSNNLGIDQKLLRLRYGKFLGDEAEAGESDIGGLDDLSDFSNADKIRDALTDKHDNAEDASFYEPETKKQLRAILSQMWDAEAKLRVFTPQAALPFEYKALRLLKDLQQQSRVYVAKASYKTTPLDLKKRLTGDLSKILLPVVQKDLIHSSDDVKLFRDALPVLDRLKQTGRLADSSVTILQQVQVQLQAKAIQQPGLYIGAVQAMQRLVKNSSTKMPVAVQDIETVEKGLQQMLLPPERLPFAGQGATKQTLAKQYFKNLQKLRP